MKTFPFYLLLTFAVLIFSCAKEQFNIEPDLGISSNSFPRILTKKEVSEWQKNPEKKSTYPNYGGPTDPTDCPYDKCDEAIPYWGNYYQDLANELCETIWFEVVCCQDGYIAYALGYVEPNSPYCDYPVEIAAD